MDAPLLLPFVKFGNANFPVIAFFAGIDPFPRLACFPISQTTGREIRSRIPASSTLFNRIKELLDISFTEWSAVVVPSEIASFAVEIDRVVNNSVAVRIVVRAQALPDDLVDERFRTKDLIHQNP